MDNTLYTNEYGRWGSEIYEMPWDQWKVEFMPLFKQWFQDEQMDNPELLDEHFDEWLETQMRKELKEVENEKETDE